MRLKEALSPSTYELFQKTVDEKYNILTAEQFVSWIETEQGQLILPTCLVNTLFTELVSTFTTASFSLSSYDNNHLSSLPSLPSLDPSFPMQWSECIEIISPTGHLPLVAIRCILQKVHEKNLSIMIFSACPSSTQRIFPHYPIMNLNNVKDNGNLNLNHLDLMHVFNDNDALTNVDFIFIHQLDELIGYNALKSSYKMVHENIITYGHKEALLLSISRLKNKNNRKRMILVTTTSTTTHSRLGTMWSGSISQQVS